MLTAIMAFGLLGVLALLLLACFILREIRFALHLISQQLEYLGAPLEYKNGVLFASRRRFDKGG
jgi:hypothetical protein